MLSADDGREMFFEDSRSCVIGSACLSRGYRTGPSLVTIAKIDRHGLVFSYKQSPRPIATAWTRQTQLIRPTILTDRLPSAKSSRIPEKFEREDNHCMHEREIPPMRGARMSTTGPRTQRCRVVTGGLRGVNEGRPMGVRKAEGEADGELFPNGYPKYPRRSLTESLRILELGNDTGKGPPK